jgi:hypothetical protein
LTLDSDLVSHENSQGGAKFPTGGKGKPKPASAQR